MTSPPVPAMLFVSASVICTPGMDRAKLTDLADAIAWARERYPLWLYVLKTEGESTWLRFAQGYLDGQHLNVTDQSPKNQLRRVLREVAQKTKVGVEPRAVWLMSDTTPAALGRREELQLAGNIQARLMGDATFRILESRLGYPVTGDDLLEVFMAHERAPWDAEF